MKLCVLIGISICLAGCTWPDVLNDPETSDGSLSPATVDLALAEAIAIRAADSDPEYNQLHKRSATGEWSPVEFRSIDDAVVDLGLNLVDVLQLNDSLFALMYSSRDGGAAHNVTDTFVLDVSTFRVYYLNQVADFKLSGAAEEIGGELVIAADGYGNVYYSASNRSSDNFNGGNVERREHGGVVKLVLEPDGSATGTYLNADVAGVCQFGVDLRGNVVYRQDDWSNGRLAIVSLADGSTDVLSNVVPELQSIHHLYTGLDHRIWVMGSVSDWHGIHSLEFEDGEHVVEQLVSTGGSPQKVTKVGSYLYYNLGNDDVSRISAGGSTSTVEISTRLADRFVIKLDRYMFTEFSNESNGNQFALVDFDEESFSTYPLDSERYRLEELSEYALDETRVIATLTDILTGSTEEWALSIDGTVELLSEVTEEPVIVRIFPL